MQWNDVEMDMDALSDNKLYQRDFTINVAVDIILNLADDSALHFSISSSPKFADHLRSCWLQSLRWLQ